MASYRCGSAGRGCR